MPYALITIAAFLVAAAMTPVAKTLAHKLGMVALPGGRRKHNGAIARTGGIPLYVGYMVAIGLILWLLPPESERVFRPIRGVIFGTTFLFVGGLIDDKYDLSYGWQFAIQFGAAFIANLHVAFLERISNPIPGLTDIPIPGVGFDSAENLIVFSTPVAWIITTIWIVGIINAVNFFDGVDGLATGVGAIACLMFAWHGFTLPGQTTVPTFPLALAAVLIGFLIFNFSPATIFLGSAGAYILAYNLATLSLLAPAKLATALLVLALPILDGLYRAIARIRQGRSPFSGDRGHLHFLLLDQGWPVRNIVLLYYTIAIIFGSVAIFAPSGLPKLITLGVLTVGIVIFIAIRSNRANT